MTAPYANALGETLGAQTQADVVGRRAGERTEAVEQAQRLQDSGIDAHAHAMIARLDTTQGGAARKCPLRHNRGRQLPPLARFVKVRTEGAQGMAHSYRGAVGGRHGSFLIH
jgi:hypothetical protein